MRQPSTPFAERATVKCEIPVRASTRARSTVSPATSTAAGLNTTFTAVGQSSAVRSGFAGVPAEELGRTSRRRSSRPQSARHAERPAASSTSCARWKARVDSAPSLALTVVVAEAVAAAASREVVERPAESVPPQEPVERTLSAHAVHRVAGDRERRQLGLDERGGVQRLLVTGSRSRFGAIAAA